MCMKELNLYENYDKGLRHFERGPYVGWEPQIRYVEYAIPSPLSKGSILAWMRLIGTATGTKIRYSTFVEAYQVKNTTSTHCPLSKSFAPLCSKIFLPELPLSPNRITKTLESVPAPNLFPVNVVISYLYPVRKIKPLDSFLGID